MGNRQSNFPPDKILITLFMFMAGVLSKIDVNIIGRFSGTEILFIGLFPYVLFQCKQFLKDRRFVGLVWLFVLYAVWIILSDILVSNYFELFLRGIMRPIVVFIIFINLLYFCYRQPSSLVYLLIGMFFSAAFVALSGTGYRLEENSIGYNLYAYRWTPVVSASASAIAFLLSFISMYASGLFVLALAVGYAALASRTTGMVLFSAGVVFFFHRIFQGRVIAGKFRLPIKRLMVYAVAALILLSGMFVFYSYAAPRGILGETARIKYMDQSTTTMGATPWGMLLAGRYNIISNWLMIKEDPIFGKGSWPEEGPYILEALLILGETIPEQAYAALSINRGTGHSIILGSYSNNGIFAFIFWMFVFWQSLKLCIHFMRFETKLSLLMFPYLLTFLMALWLTPLGPQDRLMSGLVLALYILMLNPNGDKIAPRLPRWMRILRRSF